MGIEDQELRNGSIFTFRKRHIVAEDKNGAEDIFNFLTQLRDVLQYIYRISTRDVYLERNVVLSMLCAIFAVSYFCCNH